MVRRRGSVVFDIIDEANTAWYGRTDAQTAGEEGGGIGYAP